MGWMGCVEFAGGWVWEYMGLVRVKRTYEADAGDEFSGMSADEGCHFSCYIGGIWGGANCGCEWSLY